MKGNPGVTTFMHDGRDQIYAFVRGDNGRLYVCFWNAVPNITSWQWADLGQPPLVRVNSSPTVITSIQNDNAREHYLHIFLRGNDGHLYEHFWDGFRWMPWVDHGHPTGGRGATVAMSPEIATFRGRYGEDDDVLLDAADRLLVFAWGSDELLYRYLPRDRSWRTQGLLPNPQANVVSEPAVIKHNSPTIPCIYAYVVGNDSRLYVNHSSEWTARNWFWRDLGQPNANTMVGWLTKPGLASFTSGRENRIYAFVLGSDGHLWAHFWTGFRQQGQGTWVDLGSPSGTTLSSESSVAIYTYNGTKYMYTFVRSANGHLYQHRWDGGNDRLWADFGQPTTSGHNIQAGPQGGNTRVSSAPDVVTFRFVEPNKTTDRIYVFVIGADDHLHQCYWNGADRWLWNDLGAP